MAATTTGAAAVKALAIILAGLLAVPAGAAGQYSPYAEESFSRNVYWGDTHLHSSLSTDAFGFGVKLGPKEAFRFASGEQVETSWGLNVRLSRPLDFVVLSDHAEAMGAMDLVRDGDPRLLEDEEVRRWYEAMRGSPALPCATVCYCSLS